MKRFISAFLVLVALFLCGCTQTSVSEGEDVVLTFVYMEADIRVTLETEEAEKVISILDGNDYDSIGSGIPSCGFDENISLTVDGRVFAVACDTCNYLQDMGNYRYFSIPKEDMAYIHSLFQKYGGYFPCI